MKTFAHFRPVRDESGQIIGQKPAPCSRVTAAELGGNFGSDRRRRLVVTLLAGDLVSFRPERTRQVVTMLAVDLYRVALRAVANRISLEKARNRKVAVAARRMAARIRRADQRMSRPLEE